MRNNTDSPEGKPSEAPDVSAKNAMTLWNSLPTELQEAAAEFGETHWDASLESLQLSIIDAAHERGRGNKPWYARFILDGDERVVKLSKGGRGKTGTTTRHVDE